MSQEHTPEDLHVEYVIGLIKTICSEWTKNIPNFSKLLYETLECTICSNAIRKFVNVIDIQNCVITCIRVLLKDGVEQPFIYVDAGGWSEGTYNGFANSDRDTIVVNSNLFVYDTIQTNKDHILMVTDESTPAGYVKLQLVQDGNVVTREDDNKYKSFCMIKVDKYGRPLLCNECHYCVLSNQFHYKRTDSVGSTRHGPALTISEFPRNHISNLYNVEADMVDAFFCPSSPFDISNLKHFSMQAELQNLNLLGCFVVPVGSAGSEEHDFQWRISFNLQERYIIRNFNATQHKCFVLLKIIRYYLLQPTVGNILRSYHCKMAMFYVIAELPKEIWIPENLIQCTLHCLERLKDWIINERIPNFFIPDENTFQANMPTEHKIDLVAILNNLITSKCYMLIENVEALSDEFIIMKMLCDYEEQLKTGRLLSPIPHEKYIEIKGHVQEMNELKSIFKDDRPFLTDICFQLRNNILIQMCDQTIDDACAKLHKILSGLEKLKKTNYECKDKFMFFQELLMKCLYSSNEDTNLNVRTEYSENIITKVVELVQPILHILLGTFYSVHHVLEKTSNYKENAIHHFETGRVGPVNSIQANLMEASMYLALGEHDKCKELLKMSSQASVLSINECVKTLTSVAHQQQMILLPQYNRQELDSCYTPLQLQFTNCFEVATCPVSFSYNQLDMVPPPVVYEMYKMFGVDDISDLKICDTAEVNWSLSKAYSDFLILARVDAAFYMYFLQYRLFTQTQKKINQALHKMEDFMRGNNILAHRDTAWNLLGDIYRTLGWYKLALKCFKVSFQIEPKYNAAKWHIACLLLQYSNKSLHKQSEQK